VITLVTGGARSGKTGYAQRLAAGSGREVVYIATAQAGDAEMAERIGRHRAQRPSAWRTLEEPLTLGAALRAHAQADRCIVVDCLTLWLSNLLHLERCDAPDWSEPGPRFAAEREALRGALAGVQGEVILIGNEVGLGIVPLGALNRVFVDEAGRLNQEIAAVAGRVVLMVAGCPLFAKGAP